MTERTVGEMGEIAVVERILAATASTQAHADPGTEESRADSGRVTVGPGDDAAVVATPDGRVVITTDMLVEGRHFRRDWSRAEDIGCKAAAENLADIAAMGARATGLVVALALPPDTDVAWVDGFLEGLLEEAARAGTTLLGGDLVAADSITIGVTAFGDLGGRRPVLRSSACAGDVVAVCGSLGCAAAGLAVLSRGFRSPRALVDAHRRPRPDYTAGVRANDAGVHAMMDVSDGLLIDARRLAQASGVDMDITAAALPVDDVLASTAAAYNLDPLQWVLGGGDDHALLATFASGRDVPEGFTVIGSVSAAGSQGPTITVDGKKRDHLTGFEHFRS